MPRSRHLMPVRQLLAEVNTLNVENFVVEVERDGKDLVLSPEALSALSKIDTNGRLHGLVNTSGELTEVNSSLIDTKLSYENRLSQIRSRAIYNAPPYTSSGATTQATPHLGLYGDIVLSGGSLANHKIVDKVAAYKCCCTILGIWSDTAKTYTLAFQDEDDAAANFVNPAFSVRVPTAGDYIPLDVSMKGNTAEKDLEVDIGGGAGAEEIQLDYIYWLET